MADAISLTIPQEAPPKFGRPLRKYFQFDDDWINLNQGSFGVCPAPISAVYQHFQKLSERRPDTFIRTEFPRLLCESRRALASLVNASAASLVFVPNATTGVNTVLRGLQYSPGDQILYFDVTYGACGNTVLYIAESTAASALRVEIPLPISDDELLARFHAAVASSNGRVKIALFDTIISLPSVRLPFERLTAACRELGILSLIDAAHGVGQIPLDLEDLDADFVTSNCHKWFFAPRGCAFLYVAERNQQMIRSTLPTSWGYTSLEGPQTVSPLPAVEGDEGWAQQFTFVGTTDGSSYLSIPAVIAFREWLGGEEKIIAYTHAIAKRGAEILRERLGTEVMQSYGTGGVGMYMIRLPLVMEEVERKEKVVDWITGKMDERGTYIAVVEYRGSWWCRVSGQVYLEEADFVKGADVMEELVGFVKTGKWLDGMEELVKLMNGDLLEK
ncbi:pyridoxal phosphate-dependent transferase [Trichophaea hybrida]|nr:pyridoxal phosphate-dependent transferase [Trichophaea hybrida]